VSEKLLSICLYFLAFQLLFIPCLLYATAFLFIDTAYAVIFSGGGHADSCVRSGLCEVIGV
jgi:hypothetical protein